ncbi:hypothetical protein [Nostoc sp.]|uniref:hypothetical protein n=1 Tax=Nostoc sp. TaxID=1180 RepID=UPI002FFA2EF5
MYSLFSYGSHLKTDAIANLPTTEKLVKFRNLYQCNTVHLDVSVAKPEQLSL